MTKREIIDADIDPRERRGAVWRSVRRFVLPACGVIAIVAFMVTYYVFDFFADRRNIVALSAEMIGTIEKRVRAQVAHSIGIGNAAVDIIAGFTADVLLEPGREEIDGIAVRALTARPVFAQLFFGYPNGDFLMVSRTPDETLDTKRIVHNAGRRTVSWTRRDPAGNVLRVEPVAMDRYDPRERPWYVGALEADGVHWTDVYIFFESGVPGITVSRAARSEDGEVIAVVGLDLSLAALSDFIASLKIGRTGIAFILNEDGRLIAFPEPEKIVAMKNGALEHRRLDELGDPFLTELYDRLRVSGPERSVITIDGERYIVSASTLSGLVGRDWSLVFVVPQSDFTAFFEANTRIEVVAGLVIIAMIVALAAVLTYQAVVADRRVRAMRARQRTLDRQRAAFQELTAAAATSVLDDERGLHPLTEAAARGLDVRRISIWRVHPDGRGIRCWDCFDAMTGEHTSNFSILEGECPALMTALRSGDEIEIEDSADDARAAGLDEAHLGSRDCRALLSVPIRVREWVAGCVWIEDTVAPGPRTDDAKTFARGVANIVAAWLTPAQGKGEAPRQPSAGPPDAAPMERHAPPPPMRAETPAPAASMRATSLAEDRERQVLAELARRDISNGGFAATLFPRASVLVLRIRDDVALAATGDETERATVFARLVGACEEAAATREVVCVKVLADTILAASGFNADDAAVGVIADLALELRGQCTHILANVKASTAFTIGVDTGPIMAARVGREAAAYNIWGQAVRVATTMAATAHPGTIQVSEAAYELLHGRYLLRRRGRFHLEAVGDLATYVLGAQL